MTLLGNILSTTDIIPSTVSVLAAEDIPAFSVVRSDGKVANSSVLAGFNRVIGVNQAAINSGFMGTLVHAGEIVNPAWDWVRGDVLYLNGTALSTVPPASGFAQGIGTARNATTVIVGISEPILL